LNSICQRELLAFYEAFSINWQDQNAITRFEL